MARNRFNRGDPKQAGVSFGEGPFAHLVKGDCVQETPDCNEYGNKTYRLDSSPMQEIQEQDSGGKVRFKGGRSGNPRKTSVV